MHSLFYISSRLLHFEFHIFIYIMEMIPSEKIAEYRHLGVYGNIYLVW